MCGILAENFFAISYAFPILLWPPLSWLADGHGTVYKSVLPPNLGGLLADRQSSPNFVTCSMVTVVYKIGLEIWGPPSSHKLAAT